MKIIDLKCKSCGANLTVKKGEETVTCPYCKNTYSIKEERAEHKDKTTTTQTTQVAVVAPVMIAMFIIIPIVVFMIIIGFAVSYSTKKNTIKNTSSNIVSTTTNTTKSDFEIASFNSGFHNGTWFGRNIWSMLDSAITSNKKNKDNIIVVKYKDKQSTSNDDIIEIKRELEQFTEYEVILDYDEDGLVNSITIKDI